jgi:hypothetical protein
VLIREKNHLKMEMKEEMKPHEEPNSNLNWIMMRRVK